MLEEAAGPSHVPTHCAPLPLCCGTAPGSQTRKLRPGEKLSLRPHRALVGGLRAELPASGVCTLPQGEGSSVWMGQEHMAWSGRPAPNQTTLWGDGSGVEHPGVVGNVLLPAWQSGRLPGGGDVAAHPHPEGQRGTARAKGREGRLPTGSAWGSRCRVDHEGPSGATGSHHTFLRVRGKLGCAFLKVHSGCPVDSESEDVRAGRGGGPYQAGTGRRHLRWGPNPVPPPLRIPSPRAPVPVPTAFLGSVPRALEPGRLGQRGFEVSV